MDVGLFIPCYVDSLFPQVGRLAAELLEGLGVRVDYDPRQTCCGQPAMNSGYAGEAAATAEHFVRVFGKYETIVCVGGSCAAMVRGHYGALLGRHEPVSDRVVEFCSFLTDRLGVDDLGAALPGRAALHVPCHMLRELDGAGPVRRLLSCVRGLEIVELPSDDWCCGFGGTFSVKYPELSAAMARRKLDQMAERGMDYLISPESSCLMQLMGLARREGRGVRGLHVVEVLSGQAGSCFRPGGAASVGGGPAGRCTEGVAVQLTDGFRRRSAEKAADAALGDRLHAAEATLRSKRAALIAEMPDWQDLRRRARDIKRETLERMEMYAQAFTRAAERSGTVVSRAATAEDACRQIVALARSHGMSLICKGKSMTTEEIGLNDALRRAGVQAVETDFGEYICQLAGEMPSHVTAPIIHRSIEDVAALLAARGIVEGGDQIRFGGGSAEGRLALAASLVGAVRRRLRPTFFDAGMGVTGANFAVASSGTLVLLENEANIRLSTSLPPIHVAVVGIDKLIPRIEDLAVLLTLLPVSATGQRQTAYVSLIHRPGQRLHVILLDNGRSRVLADPEQSDLLSCIRCGACMGACPVYRHVSGHAYGGVYPGPIGAVLMPHLRPDGPARELPFASSLCGACNEVCPVGIPLAERLLQWRARLTSGGGRPWGEGAAFKGWAWLMRHPGLYRSLLDSPRLWRGALSMPGPLRAWLAERDLPPLPDETFSASWPHRVSRSLRVLSPEKSGAAASEPDPPAASEPEPTGAGSASDGSAGRKAAPRPASRREMVERFIARLDALRAPGDLQPAVYWAADEGEAAERLGGMCAGIAEGEILWGTPPYQTDRQAAAQGAFRVGVTEAAALIAETGSIVVEIQTAVAAWPSLLVDQHVVIAGEDRMVQDLASFYMGLADRLSAARAGEAPIANQVVITGCSRTADLEKKLVIPAHGPGRVQVILTPKQLDLGVVRLRVCRLLGRKMPGSA